MSNLQIETDVAAFTIRQHLDSAKYAIAAAQANADLDYTSGLVAVVSARSLAAFILQQFKDASSDDYRRFREFNHESMKLLDAFWSVFRLAYLAHSDGTARIVQAEPVLPSKPIVVNKPARNGGTRHYGRTGLPIDVRDGIVRDAVAIPAGVAMRDWHDTVAERYGVSRQTVERYYYAHKNGAK